MTNEEIIEQLENTIGLIKQDEKDWLDDRDIPILEACIKSLTALDKIRAEIKQRPYGIANDSVIQGMRYERTDVLEIIDKYRKEQSE